MNHTISQVIFMTLILVLAFLVLKDASQFATVVNSLASGYSQSVATLQGRTV